MQVSKMVRVGLTLEGDVGDFGQLTELWSSWNQNLLGCFGHKTRCVTMAMGRQQQRSSDLSNAAELLRPSRQRYFYHLLYKHFKIPQFLEGLLLVALLLTTAPAVTITTPAAAVTNAGQQIASLLLFILVPFFSQPLSSFSFPPSSLVSFFVSSFASVTVLVEQR